MNKSLCLYSVNSWLAWKISQMYYNDIHYVWCAPAFKADGINPPSSNPKEIYKTYKNDVAQGDKHSAIIQRNKAGILKGAQMKKKQGVISAEEEKEIKSIVKVADISDFKPIIFVAPMDKVNHLVKRVSIKYKASTFSNEYIIENLPGDCFDIIEFWD